MKTCTRCDKQKVVAITLDDNIEVCGHTFTASMPADKCQACGQIAIQGHDMKLFELAETGKGSLPERTTLLVALAAALDDGGQPLPGHPRGPRHPGRCIAPLRPMPRPWHRCGRRAGRSRR